MKNILYLISCIIICCSAQTICAEETINVLIVDDPYAPGVTGQAENIGSLNGEIFINGQSYSGLINVKRDENGLHVINMLPLEKYIEGVVAAEIGKDWAMEALKAQAVISRTYAVYQKNLNAGKDFNITSSVMNQAYRGNSSEEIIGKAVKETAGEVLTYEGSPIEAFYHSSCTGKTELPEEVWGKDYAYLSSVSCRGKNFPYEHWIKRFDLNKIAKALGLKNINNIEIISFTSTGRVKMLKIAEEDSEREIRAVDLRKSLGYRELPSTQFTVSLSGNEAVFEGGGYGHGVGLSQWGALELAGNGMNYKEILQYFYPGTQLQKM